MHKEVLPLIRMATRFPLLTGLAIVVAGFFIYAAIFVVTRLVVDPDHVVVTSYQVSGENDNGNVAVTINRISYHPATKVRGIFGRQTDSTARPEYIQVDGTIALSAGSSSGAAFTGPVIVLIDSERQLERGIRTHGNICSTSGWPPAAVQVTQRPGDFSIRIPVRDEPLANTILESLKNGHRPDITLTGIYYIGRDCESFEELRATTPHEISIETTGNGAGVKQDFYPYGEPRFDEPGDADRELWREWARGWVPGEF